MGFGLVVGVCVEAAVRGAVAGVCVGGAVADGVAFFGITFLTGTLAGTVGGGVVCTVAGFGTGSFGPGVRFPLVDAAVTPAGVFEIFVSNSSRTVSLIIAPQVRQMERVGARSRLQTGHIIKRIGFSWIDCQSDSGKSQKEYQRLL
jgi:hypothetical protein